LDIQASLWGGKIVKLVSSEERGGINGTRRGVQGGIAKFRNGQAVSGGKRGAENAE